MGTRAQRWGTIAAIALARRAAAWGRVDAGRWAVARLDIACTRSLGRLEAAVVGLCLPAYRRTWLVAARRLLALSGRARRGEINAREVAEKLANLPFLWTMPPAERHEIVRLCAVVGAPLLAERIPHARAARALAAFLGCLDGAEAGAVFAAFLAARPLGSDDRARMIAKTVMRVERGLIDEGDAVRFAARLGDARGALAVARQLPLAAMDRVVLAEAVARAGHRAAAREIAGDLLAADPVIVQTAAGGPTKRP